MFLHFMVHCISGILSRRTYTGICVVYGLKWRGSLVIILNAVIYTYDVLFGYMLERMCNMVMSLTPSMFMHMEKMRGSGGEN